MKFPQHYADKSRGIMSKLALNIRTQGLFRNRQVIKHRPRTWDLSQFLRRDDTENVYLRQYPIHQGKLELQLTLEDKGKMNAICALMDLTTIYVAIREETVSGNSKKRKVLYGWAEEKDWGVMTRARIRYVIAEREAGREWKILKNPVSLGELNKGQEDRLANRLTVEAVTQGLGKRKLGRFWTIISNKKNFYVCYAHQGKPRLIYGFEHYKKVYSLITEEKDQIIARFYRNPEAAKEDKGLIKTAVLSEKIAGAWTPLVPPRVTFTKIALSHQHQRIEIREVNEFLVADKEGGEYLDLDPRYVNEGKIYFCLDGLTDEPHNGIIVCTGYTEYTGQRLPGRIAVEGKEKRVYFWTDEKSRQESLAPITTPKMRVMAQKDENGVWQINWQASSPERRAKTVAAKNYGNFLFATVKGRSHKNTWSTTAGTENGYERVRARKGVRGKYMSFEIPASLAGTELFAVTREIRRRFKLVKFWPSEESYGRKEDPLAARFITFRANGEWGHFWAKLEAEKKFEALITAGKITLAELKRVLGDPLLAGHTELSWLFPERKVISASGFDPLMGTPGHMFEVQR